VLFRSEAADLAVVSQILADAFTPGDDLDGIHAWTDVAGIDGLRTITVDGRIVGTMRQFEMGQYFGGKRVELVGIAGVAVAPECRASGIGQVLMREGLRELHDRGVPISTLYASASAFYRKVGYETAGALFRASVPASLLPRTACPLTIREFTPDDFENVRACYERFAQRHDGYLSRGKYVWDRVQAPRSKPARGYVFVADGGTIEGYIFHRQELGGQSESLFTLNVTDLCAVTPAARDTLFAYLRGFSSINGTVTFESGPMHPLVLGLVQQRIELKIVEHWMLRITHLRNAIEQRGYPSHANAEISFHLIDELLPDNAGDWTLRVSNGSGILEPGGTPAMTIDAKAFASMYTGFASAHDLRTWAHLACEDESTLDACNAIFRGPSPSMADMF